MNRLAGETSPYLRQHQDNPVDWYPWGEEAFELARRTDRPLFVSIGYSACHWCHVMAHESFEDEATAALLNEHFVSIKVDREERPDIDAIYLEAVQALTGSGGWPLSVFLGHDAKPFFGGTYFPKRDAHGLPSFTHLLQSVASAWRDKRSELDEQAEVITKAVTERVQPVPDRGGKLTAASAEELSSAAIERYRALFDAEYGGIGNAPKFPQAPMLELVLEHAASGDAQSMAMLETTLSAMASGGIYDHLGGGFARYSVDRSWLVPHFEKMLYDQASLARVYLHAFQISGEARWRQVLDETLGYVLRDLKDPSGAIYSAEDADSEGEEGRFYTWSATEIVDLLGDEADAVMAWYGVNDEGNFEGRSILHRPKTGELTRPAAIESGRHALFGARARRVRPGLDDKVITEWNAMIAGVLAEAGAATRTSAYLDAARQIGEFLYRELRRPDGRWLRSWQGGHALHLATAADYAWVIDCYTRLGESTGEAIWTERAAEVAEGLIELFSANGGGWYLTGVDAPALIVRPEDTYDGVLPAAGSIAASALARLGAVLGDQALLDRAGQTVEARFSLLAASPIAFAHLLAAGKFIASGPVEVLISGERPHLVELVQARYLPGAVLAWGEASTSTLWEGRERPGAYVCKHWVCQLPVDDSAQLEAALSATT